MLRDNSLLDFTHLVALTCQAGTDRSRRPVLLKRLAGFFGPGGTGLYLSAIGNCAAHLDPSGRPALAVTSDLDPALVASASGHFGDKNVSALNAAALQTVGGVTGGTAR